MPATSAPSPETLGPLALALRAILLTAHFLIFVSVFLIHPLLKRQMRGIAAWWDRRLLHLLGLRIHVVGEPARPAALTVSNHVSWLDIVLLGGVMHAAFVSKAEVRNWPMIGRFAAMLGTVFLPRGQFKTGEATQLVGQTLNAGQPVVLFPSATTLSDLLPPRFHARMFAAAIEGDFAIQPVAIHYLPQDDRRDCHHPWSTWTGTADLAGHFLRLCTLRRLQVRLTFCPVIPATGMERRQLADASRASIIESLSAEQQYG